MIDDDEDDFYTFQQAIRLAGSGKSDLQYISPKQWSSTEVEERGQQLLLRALELGQLVATGLPVERGSVSIFIGERREISKNFWERATFSIHEHNRGRTLIENNRWSAEPPHWAAEDEAYDMATVGTNEVTRQHPEYVYLRVDRMSLRAWLLRSARDPSQASLKNSTKVENAADIASSKRVRNAHKRKGLSLAEADAPIIEEMRRLIESNEARSITAAAGMVWDTMKSKIAGYGNDESRRKRLERAYRKAFEGRE